MVDSSSVQKISKRYVNVMKKIKIPGDTIIVPMFIGCFINTFIPQILQIGGFTTPIVKGAGPLVGAFLFVIGGTISLKNTPKAVVRGASIIIAKIIVSIILGLLVAKVFNDNLLGLSAVAVIGAISVANNAMYAGIVEVGFCLGANMNFGQILEGGLPGILLGVITTLIGGVAAIAADKLSGGNGVAGAAISSTAASAIATPAALSAVDASFKAIEATATTQITASVIVTAILTPILTAYIAKRVQQKDKNVG